MKIISELKDHKVDATSYLVEITIRDYLDLAKDILYKNEFQRRRVRSSKSIYSLLKNDITVGCILPPIVLSYSSDGNHLLDDAIKNDKDKFLILDGLQRTFTLFDVLKELGSDVEKRDEFLSRIIRCDIYKGINRLGILYRMLTLNTGQTAMSLRHQIEIMYSDFIDSDIDGIRLVTEAEQSKARGVSVYNFKDAIEGFNSYLEREETPLGRGELLENIASLESLSKENDLKNSFVDYLRSWDFFIKKVNEFDIHCSSIDPKSASSGIQLFKKSQAFSGYGAAVGSLKDFNEISSFEDISECIKFIEIGTDGEEFIEYFNEVMNKINNNAKKIGTAQRYLFRQFFTLLFSKDGKCYKNMMLSIREASSMTSKFAM